MKRLYLAGKWEERALIDEHAKVLEALGYTITHTWFRPGSEEGWTLAQIAQADLEAVKQADVCIFFFANKLPYSGAVTELGIALALRKRIYMIGDGASNNIFTHHSDIIRADNFDQLLHGLHL